MRLSIDLNTQSPSFPATIVTPQRLYADVIATQYAKKRLSTGELTWERPAISTIYSWLSELWQNERYSGASRPDLLTPVQEEALWRGLFKARHPGLFDFDSAARLAVSASRTIAEWNVPMNDDSWEQHRDAREFRLLYREFSKECRQRNCITRSDLWKLAPQWLEKSTPVGAVGFDYKPPALQSLKLQHWDIVDPNLRRKARRCPITRFETVSDEIENCARWARFLLEENESISLGILVVNLREHARTVWNAFDSVFYPAGAVEPQAIHFHSRETLHQEPLVKAATLLLRLGERQLSTEEASAVLRSRWLSGAAAERGERALADVTLRKSRDLRVSIHQLERCTSKCPILQGIWKAVHRALVTRPHYATLSVWSDWMSNFLAETGWPGDYPLDNYEQEVLESWKSALSQLSELSYVFGAVSFEVAQQELYRILELVTAPATGGNFSPVQVLEANDAYGLVFDAVSIVGLNEGQWPLPERAQPFIPAVLRRRAGIPGSTPSLASEIRARKTQWLFRSAALTVASYTEALSPLAADYVSNARASKDDRWLGPARYGEYPAAELEALVDEEAPALAISDAVQGGAGIIKSQSHCPFQAFARYRLIAYAPEDPAFGLDARDRGGYLHRSLEHAWRTIADSEQLHRFSPEELRALVSESVNKAVLDDTNSPFHQLVSETERLRLNETILEWLEFEKTRKIPFVVEDIEEKRSVELAGLRLNLRIDRIDRLPDGSVVLVDYKSGQTFLKHLLGQRPYEPQLLVYASATSDEVDGVFLAQVRARECAVSGMATREHFPERKSKSAPDWLQERKNLRERLETIAAEFVAGVAVVEPQGEACNFCGLQSLCRIAENGSGREEGND